MKLILGVYIPEIRSFIPVQVEGTNWDVLQMRIQLKAEGRCTAMYRKPCHVR